MFGTRFVKFMFVLFNDMLVTATRGGKITKAKIKRVFRLNGMTVVPKEKEPILSPISLLPTKCICSCAIPTLSLFFVQIKVSGAVPDSADRKNAFNLTINGTENNNTTYVLTARTPQEKDNWVRAIHLCIIASDAAVRSLQSMPIMCDEDFEKTIKKKTVETPKMVPR